MKADTKKLIGFLKLFKRRWLFADDNISFDLVIKKLRNYSKLEKENKVLKNRFKRKNKLPKGLVTGIPKKKNRRTK